MTSIIKVDTLQNTAGDTALTIDNGGRVLQPTKPAFKAYATGGWQSVASSGIWYTLPFNIEDHDIGGHYNTSTYTFTCPSTGAYFFGGHHQHDANAVAEARILVNGTYTISYTNNRTQGDSAQVNTTGYMTAGDTVVYQAKFGNVNADDWYASVGQSYFFGYLIG